MKSNGFSNIYNTCLTMIEKCKLLSYSSFYRRSSGKVKKIPFCHFLVEKRLEVFSLFYDFIIFYYE